MLFWCDFNSLVLYIYAKDDTFGSQALAHSSIQKIRMCNIFLGHKT